MVAGFEINQLLFDDDIPQVADSKKFRRLVRNLVEYVKEES